jgi:predicted SAM-dependent methyltransferase
MGLIREFVKARLSDGSRRAVRALIEELKLQRIHRRSLHDVHRYLDRGDLKLHLGCGGNCKPGWVNIDISLVKLPIGPRNPDLWLDLREDLPFPDGSASVIYSEHFFEHLDYPRDVKHLLREAMRVLEPRGLFSVGVPDTAYALESYVYGNEEFFRVTRERKWHPAWCRTWMHQINYHFWQDGEHKWQYDFETLAQVLADAGFVDVVQRPFDPSLDSEYRRWGTLYADARKPG